MKILFAVPSKNRADILEKNTYKWLQFIPFDWNIFVEPQEFQNIINIKENDKGLSYVKDFIQKYAIQHGYDLVFKIDDDVKCFTDFRKRTEPVECAIKVHEFCNIAIEYFTKYPNLGAITFPYSFQMYENYLFHATKRVQTCYIVRPKFLTVDKDISCFEDFAVGINIMLKGSKIIQYGLMGQELGVKVGGGTGGLQSFNRKEKSLKELDMLREMYPPLKFREVFDKEWQYEPDLRSVQL